MSGAESPRRPQEDGDSVQDSLTDALYRRHASWLEDRLRRLGPASAAEAEDLVQETYVRALQIQRTHPIVHPRALLLRIAGRLAIDHGRRARRTVPLAQETAERIPCDPEQDGDLLLKQVIMGLPPRLRDVFVLSRLAGFSYDRIARELGLSVKTVEARMTKALSLCTAGLRR